MKRPCFALIEQYYVGDFFQEREIECFVALRPLELDVQSTICFIFVSCFHSHHRVISSCPPHLLTATCLQNSTCSPSSSKNSTLPSEIQKAVCGMDGYFMEFPIVYHWLFASQAYKEVFSKSSEMT